MGSIYGKSVKLPPDFTTSEVFANSHTCLKDGGIKHFRKKDKDKPLFGVNRKKGEREKTGGELDTHLQNSSPAGVAR